MASSETEQLKIAEARDAYASVYGEGAEKSFIAGLDGFVDEICHVVGSRRSVDQYDRLNMMADFGNRISDAAGKSTNIEMVVQQMKIGGNGPIMAGALGTLSMSMTYIGALGRGRLHPVFEPLSEMGEIFSLCDPAHTDAVEFDDGKIMLGKMSTLSEITPDAIADIVGVARLRELLGRADLLSLVNWTMVAHKSDIFEWLLQDILPETAWLTPNKPIAFFDLADPAKRTREDLARAVGLIARFAEYYHVILGVNEKESRHVAEILPGEAPIDTLEVAAYIQKNSGIPEVVVHPTNCAAVAVENGDAHRCEGPYTPTPKITTGAGDHFNAGYCFARVLGLPPEQAIVIGKGVSGFYVRAAASPTPAQLLEFLGQWAEGAPPDRI